MEFSHKTTLLVVGIHLVLTTVMSISEAQGSNATTTEKEDLYIVAMLPYPVQNGTHPVWQATREDGPDIAPAIYLAVEQINNRTDILNNYTLHVIESDGACNIRTRTYIGLVQALYVILENRHSRLVGIVGPACSDSADVVASITSTIGLPLVSLHSGANPILGKYPHSFGIGGSVSMYAETLVQLVIYSRWHKVGILYSDIDHDRHLVYQHVYNILRKTDVDVPLVLPVSETYMPLQTIKDDGIRVIITFTGLEYSLQIMCLAYHLGVTFPSHQWVFVDRRLDYFLQVNFHYNGREYSCSDEQIQEVVEGSLVVLLDLRVDDDTVTVSGQYYSQYIHHYKESIKRYRKVHGVDSTNTIWANPMYDATWALALALNESITACDANNLTDSTTDELYRINFTGTSGVISFDSQTRFAKRTIGMFQFRNGSSRAYGYYSDSTGFVATNQSSIIISSDFDIEEIDAVPATAGLCFLLIISAPLIPTVFSHVTSVVYRRFRPIKASSYRLNQLAYAGFYVFMVGIAVFTVQEMFELNHGTHDKLCVAMTWAYGISLSLVLGTICMKCVRLHKLYSAAEHLKQITNRWLLWDSTLSFGVAVLLLPQVVLLTLQTVSDPPQWRELTRTSESSHVTKVTFGCVSDGNSGSFWFLLRTGYNSLLALFAFWLAHNSRKLQEKGFHVKNVIALVYILTFATLCLIPPVVYVFTRTTTSHVASAVYFIGAAYLTTLVYSCTALLFLPPVIVLFRGKWKGEFGGKSFWSTTPSAVRVKPKTQPNIS